MIVSPVHFRELAAIEEMRERAEVIALLHRYGTTSCVISTPSENERRRYRPEDLVLPMPCTSPLRK
jgi:hypothetical protein